MPSWLDKRVLPLLALLAAAIVAVPFVLRPDTTPDGPPPAAPPAADRAALEATPVVAPAQAGDRSRRRKVVGQRKDPFRPTNQQRARKAPAVAPAASASAGARTAAATAPAVAAPKPAPASPPASAPVPVRIAPAAPRVRRAGPVRYAVDIRIGRGPGARRLRDLPRLTALPSSAHPLLVYLGLLTDHRTAVFLVPSVVRVVSDGACKPSRSSCERVHLREDETIYFEQDVDGRTLQYELELLDVSRRRKARRTGTARTAAAADRNRRLARWLVGLQEDRLGGIRWDARKGGLVYPAKRR